MEQLKNYTFIREVNYSYNKIIPCKFKVKKKTSYNLFIIYFNYLLSNNLKFNLKLFYKYIFLLNFKKYKKITLNKINKYKVYATFNKLHKLIRYLYMIEKNFWLNIKLYLNINIIKFLRQKNINIYIYSIDNKYLIASIILKDISKKLAQQNYSLFEVINPLIYNLEKNLEIKGFKISCAGRFARKQRATYYWVRKKVLSLNNFSEQIEYAKKAITLRYGVCGVKIWLSKPIQHTKSIYLVV